MTNPVGVSVIKQVNVQQLAAQGDVNAHILMNISVLANPRHLLICVPRIYYFLRKCLKIILMRLYKPAGKSRLVDLLSCSFKVKLCNHVP